MRWSDLREFWWVLGCVVGAVAIFYVTKIVLRVRRATRAFREVNRRTALKCVQCGYDLRVATDHCPECGEAVPPEWTEARLNSGGWPGPRS